MVKLAHLSRTRHRGPHVTFRPHVAPLVSIVTATFNARALLPITLDSVIEQTYPACEYIVIDGGSIDGTRELLIQHDRQLGYWASERDRGIYDALNKGIAAARGEWLLFLGAGDTLAGPEVLAQAMTASQTGQLLYGDVLIGAARRRYGGRFRKGRLTRQNICHQAIFYHRELFERHGLYDLRYPVWADWAFNLRCFADSRTSPRYLGQIVARYDDTGFSSTRQDAAFLADAESLVRPLGALSLAEFRAKRLVKRLHGRT